MKKLLITGATGFIGGFLVQKAVDLGYEVFVSIRKNSDISQIKHLPIHFIELNLSNIDQMRMKLGDIQPHIIINNAGLTKAKTQAELDLVNATYAHNLAVAAMQAIPTLERYVYVSSLAAYGPADSKNDAVIREIHDPQPVTMYGVSKLKAEKLLRSIEHLPFIILRPTAVYGPRERDLYTVFKMVNAGFSIHSGNGMQQLSFVYIDDLIEYILRVCETKNAQKCYFVTDGDIYTAKQLNKYIALNLGKKTVKFGLPLPLLSLVAYVSELVGKISGNLPPLNLDKLNEIKAQNWQCDVTSLVNDTNYTAKVKLEEGIAKTVAWYKKNNWL